MKKFTALFIFLTFLFLVGCTSETSQEEGKAQADSMNNFISESYATAEEVYDFFNSTHEITYPITGANREVNGFQNFPFYTEEYQAFFNQFGPDFNSNLLASRTIYVDNITLSYRASNEKTLVDLPNEPIVTNNGIEYYLEPVEENPIEHSKRLHWEKDDLYYLLSFTSIGGSVISTEQLLEIAQSTQAKQNFIDVEELKKQKLPAKLPFEQPVILFLGDIDVSHTKAQQIIHFSFTAKDRDPRENQIVVEISETELEYNDKEGKMVRDSLEVSDDLSADIIDFEEEKNGYTVIQWKEEDMYYQLEFTGFNQLSVDDYKEIINSFERISNHI